MNLENNGLGLIEGEVVNFESNEKFKVPHIGWNQITELDNEWSNTYFKGLKSNTTMYFVHSFFMYLLINQLFYQKLNMEKIFFVHP